MRILYHHRTQAEDAQGIHIQEMLSAFRHAGHEVELVALSQSNNGKTTTGSRQKLWKRLTDIIPNWLYEIMSLGYNIYGYRALRQAIRKKRPDFIYERYSLNTFCGSLVSKRLRIPLILEVNAPLCFEQNMLGKLVFKRLAKLTERWICSNSTWTVAVTNVLKQFLINNNVPVNKIITMHNGINPKIFNPTISSDSIRKKYKLETKLVIGFVGWFRKWHGLEMLLEVLYEIKSIHQDCRLLLVGDGPAYPELYSYAEQNGLLSTVHFTGPVNRDEIPQYIAAMDMAVQPSATEYACPMKIIEYMAMAKCIIAPDQPNINELLKNNRNAFLFRKHDKTDLRNVLLNAIENRKLRKVYGKAAYETIVKERMFWSANADKIVNRICDGLKHKTTTD